MRRLTRRHTYRRKDNTYLIVRVLLLVSLIHLQNGNNKVVTSEKRSTLFFVSIIVLLLLMSRSYSARHVQHTLVHPNPSTFFFALITAQVVHCFALMKKRLLFFISENGSVQIVQLLFFFCLS
ncbi:MAG: hypothetical protein J3R72DRAFT_456030 [Linnemannia gamsii]|nr:MAG: hypothetical protein J3R72DRAFT_456030 [Linnemannia gamsii]